MENLYLIVGLGNPGAEYVRTRHNAGFMLVERLADGCRAEWRVESKFQARLAWGRLGDQRCLLCEPQTYMNASGEAVSAVVAYYQAPLSRLLVVVDDADLPLGEIRLRPQGSSGGHHGLESIEERLGGREFARLRLGIGRRAEVGRRITGHVLGKFSRDEADVFEKALARAADQSVCWAQHGVVRAMNQFNGAVPAPEPKEN